MSLQFISLKEIKLIRTVGFCNLSQNKGSFKDLTIHPEYSYDLKSLIYVRLVIK
jgi:hypothetical protein